MASVSFRVYYNNAPATREQLNAIEEVTVEQEVDMAWEARLSIPVHVDERGSWEGENEEYMQPFSQVRVEIRVGEDPFVPLIDGPIVRVDYPMESEPGRSSVVLYVQDESVLLNRNEVVERHENQLDHEIASRLFGDCPGIASMDIEDTPAPTASLQPPVVQRGTPMQLLRNLARRQGMHAYVLPGNRPGRSVGCFRSFPHEPDGLPQLILLGPERNIDSFNVRHDAQKPFRTRGGVINISDKSVTSETSRFEDIDELGEVDTFESESDTGERLLPPGQGDSVDLSRYVTAQTIDSSYAFEVSGNVAGPCYPGVLTPYRVVCVRGASRRLSGSYLISQVTHTITRSEYGQSFVLKRNARSSASTTAGLSHSARGIY